MNRFQSFPLFSTRHRKPTASRCEPAPETEWQASPQASALPRCPPETGCSGKGTGVCFVSPFNNLHSTVCRLLHPSILGRQQHARGTRQVPTSGPPPFSSFRPEPRPELIVEACCTSYGCQFVRAKPHVSGRQRQPLQLRCPHPFYPVALLPLASSRKPLLGNLCDHGAASN